MMCNAILSPSLWMGDLANDMDETSIINAFSHFGERVIDVKLTRSSTAGIENYCFIEFYDVDRAQQALHRLNGNNIPGWPSKRFKLNPASFDKMHGLMPEFSLYISNLSYEVEDLQLFNFFKKKYKSTRGAKVVRDNKGRSKGFGFVRFSEEIDQQKALLEMQHMTGLGRRPIKVSLTSLKRSSEMPASSESNSHGSYYAGHYSWGGYSYHFNQSLGQPSALDSNYYPNTPNELQISIDADMEALEDPGLDVNVSKENREFIESSESFFLALENSRWQPLDNLMSEIPD